MPGPRLRIALCHLIPHLGDTILIFPLLDALQREHPDAEISCFTAGAANNLRMHPAVKQVYEFRRSSLSKKLKGGPPLYIFELWQWWRKHLRGLRFDVCVVPRGGVDIFYSAHLAWLLGGRERVGYSCALEPELNEGTLGQEGLLTKRVEQMRGVHEVQRGAEVLMLANLLEQPIDLLQPVASILEVAHGSAGQDFVRSLPELEQPYGIVSPGASVFRREWPPERFAELVEQEFLPRGWLPVFVGGPELIPMCDQIAGQLSGPSLNLAGKTNFEQLAAVSAGARCFVGNDSGTAHMAGACGVPTLIVTAFPAECLSTHHSGPNRSHPLGPFCAVVQPQRPISPCTQGCFASEPHCILQVTTEQVRDSFRELLKRSEHNEA